MPQPDKSKHRRLWSLFRVILAVPIGFVVLLGAILFFAQRSLMYHPRTYDPSYHRMLKGRVFEIDYTTSEGVQRAYYVSPRGEEDGAEPDRLWVYFHGNAGTALDWLDERFVLQNHDPGAGMLLVDLPGYGASEGSPTRNGIIANGEGALKALADRFDMDATELATKTGVLGYSMGAAAGMEFAVRHPVRGVILVAPFTSVTDIAGKLYGPFKILARDRFDNKLRLDELAAQTDPPTVWIFHGENDEIIPADMARELAERQPAITRLRIVEQMDHNWIMQVISDDVQAAMLETFGVAGDPPPASQPSVSE